MDERPTLEELRRQRDLGYFEPLSVTPHVRPSRFHRGECPKCHKMVTNQAMGRAAHRRMHERQEEKDANR
jgi:hypothetical protein